eukprot:m.157851 g.157851  ORF g.157851 m.157851 type:complete len:387 (-) comp31067_c5_seq2:77-1237(-)
MNLFWRAFISGTLVAVVFGHGSLISPPPRNSFDRNLPQYQGGRTSECNCGNTTSGCGLGFRHGMGGQSCFWFSQGCFIGCAACTGTNIEPDGMSKYQEGNNCTPGNQPAGSTLQPTLPKRLWTMNIVAVEDSINDTFRFHPWRAPGSAPVTDCCGTAGGTQPKFEGPGETKFQNVTVNGSFVSFGDLGSKVLPRGPSRETWTIGSSVEVKWGLRFNHGGGYQYRLCSANDTLDEACFMRTPLDFVRDKQALEWKNGTRLSIPGVYVDEGIIPVGSTWARNPIPFIYGKHEGCTNATDEFAKDVNGNVCRQFEPPCDEDHGWTTTPGSNNSQDVMGKCSNNWIEGAIVDEVVIPQGLNPGAYVLGFRWDCEETSQVWSSCADVTLVV